MVLLTSLVFLLSMLAALCGVKDPAHFPLGGATRACVVPRFLHASRSPPTSTSAHPHSSSQAAILILFLKPLFSLRITQLLGMTSNVRFKPAHVLGLASSSPRAVGPHPAKNPQ